MPRRKVVFESNNFYHILNRGVARMPIYKTSRDYQRFLDLLNYYKFVDVNRSFSSFKLLEKDARENYWRGLVKNSSLQVEIITFCLMPNHFHILLEQKNESGIPEFMGRVQNGYVKYFNKRNERVGPLFQSMFKAVRIETEEQLLHTSRYIHINPTTSYLTTKLGLFSYQWSSLPNYLGEKSDLVNTKMLISLVGSKSKYKKFILDQVDYQRKLADITHLTLENS